MKFLRVPYFVNGGSTMCSIIESIPLAQLTESTQISMLNSWFIKIHFLIIIAIFLCRISFFNSYTNNSLLFAYRIHYYNKNTFNLSK